MLDASIQTVKDAVSQVHTRTPGVEVGSEVRVGRDSTDEEAVWVYVVVPDDRIDEFYNEWEQLRESIRQQVRAGLGKPSVIVYIRMRAASEVGTSP